MSADIADISGSAGHCRQRCQSSDGLFEVFARHIVAPDVLAYREELDGPIDTDKLMRNRQLIVDIRAGPAANGSLVQKHTAAAVKRHFQDKEEEWHLGAELDGRATSVAKKIRAMSRDVQQAWLKSMKKGSTPKWLAVVLDIPPGQATQASHQKEKGKEEEPTFHFDRDQMLAYKMVGSRRVWCRRVGPPTPSSGDPNEEAMAYWDDGTQWSIPAMMVKHMNGFSKSKVAKQYPTQGWLHHEVGSQSMHAYVKASTRRGEKSYILWAHTKTKEADDWIWKTSQKLQLALKPEIDNDDALNFMIECCKSLAQGCAVEDLKCRRAEFLGKPLLKKPAAHKRPSASDSCASKKRRRKDEEQTSEAAMAENEDEEEGEEEDKVNTTEVDQEEEEEEEEESEEEKEEEEEEDEEEEEESEEEQEQEQEKPLEQEEEQEKEQEKDTEKEKKPQEPEQGQETQQEQSEDERASSEYQPEVPADMCDVASQLLGFD